MRTQPTRARVKAAALALGVMTAAGAAAAVLAISGPASAAGQQHGQPAIAAASKTPVVVNCSGKGVTKPSSYVFACADDNGYIDHVTWAAWGTSAAFASGTYVFNDCTPNCASGHFHSFPALVALWGAKAWPKQAGTNYFTEATLIFTGSRSYKAGGKTHTLSQTMTIPLSAGGGA